MTARQSAGFAKPDLLIDTNELEAQLGSNEMRIIDCNVALKKMDDGRYSSSTGRPDWEAAHIPGAIFLDFMGQLSADHEYLHFMMPSAEQFEELMSAHGIGNDHRVVIYSQGANYWATRLFLMFRAFGFDGAQVLNGGWNKWIKEGRAVTAEVPSYVRAMFTAAPRPGQIIGKDEVLRALDDGTTCIVNALTPDTHTGETFNPGYHRPGRIKGSVNVYAAGLVDPETFTFLPAQDLRKQFEAVGALDKERVITYCGGGISATTDSFALLLLGYENVSLYDGSMTEWGRDEALPMEVGS